MKAIEASKQAWRWILSPKTLQEHQLYREDGMGKKKIFDGKKIEHREPLTFVDSKAQIRR